MNKTLLNKIFVTSIIFLLTLTSLPVLPVRAQEENTWTSLAPMQEVRKDLGVALVDDKIYAIGNGPNHQVDTVEEYNPQTNTWTYKNSAPETLDHLSVTVYHGKIYCFSAGTGKTYAYTPLYDSWETKAPLPNTSDTIVANTINDKIYVIDGYWKILNVYYPINNSWSTKTPPLFEIDHKRIASAVLDDKIHVFGATPHENSHQIYDPRNDSWSVAKPLLYHSFYPVTCVTTGFNAPKRIYVFGVNYSIWGASATLTAQSYDPITDAWINCSLVPSGQLGGGSVTIDDKLFVIGGSTPFMGGHTFASSFNRLYTPLGFGNPDPSYTPPPVTPTPTPPEPEFPISLVMTLVIILVVGLGILVYFKKRRV